MKKDAFLLFIIISLIVLTFSICFAQGTSRYDNRSIEVIEREYQLEIPADVWVMYVILQKKGPVVEGSSMLLDRPTREEFIRQFGFYIEQAKKKDCKLVVTAQTEDGRWVHDLILYQGRRLRPTMYRDPNSLNKNFPGSEIPTI